VRRISRRSVMLGGVSAAALAVAFPLRSAAEKSITVAQFRNLSLRLTGAGLSDLDPTTAAKLLDSFMSMGRGSDLADLSRAGRRAELSLAEIQHRDDADGAGHIMGTARMVGDPKQSLVDRDLRSHDHPNLFILGSAVFPTSATANPTLTIAALSLRAVAQIKATLTQ
jgi:choline dehydrogenase-like flavoprotein